jgi:glycosyltransferase involved in cell wall biosynthesis
MLGLPIIATRCGGPENFVNSSNGFLIDTDDQEGLENALRTFLKDPGQFDPESLKKSVDYTFSKEAVGQAFLNLYNSILNR